MTLPKPSKTSDRLPTPEVGDGFDPFLRAEHIGNGKEGAKATIMLMGGATFETKGDYGPQVKVPIRLKGESYTFAVKTESGGSYPRLFKKFGDNPSKWRGKVNVEVKKHMKKLYVAVV